LAWTWRERSWAFDVPPHAEFLSLLP